MNSERLWIVILTIAAFCAGMAGGILLIQGRVPAGAGPSGIPGAVPVAFEPYRERLIEEYELSSARSRDLEAALQEYADQIDILRERSLRGLQPELIRAGEDCFLKIRDYIIPPDRRPEFDKLTAGSGASGLPLPYSEVLPGPSVSSRPSVQ